MRTLLVGLILCGAGGAGGAGCAPRGGGAKAAGDAQAAPAGATTRANAAAEGDDDGDGDGDGDEKTSAKPRGRKGERGDGLPGESDAQAAPAKPPPRVGLSGGVAALAASEYGVAEAELGKVAKGGGPERGPALVGLARVKLATGRLAEAVKLADEAARIDKASKIAAAAVKGRALARQGKLAEAQRACEEVQGEPEARRARLELGEVLLRTGKTAEAERALMTLIDDFNQRRITASDGEGMMLVGRAAHLMRSRRDANEAYDDAERAGNRSPELLLHRAALFLEAYNVGRAEEMVRAALKAAPDLAEAHIARAQVKLEQALDFDEAEREIQRALAIDVALPQAHFLRAGIALRDMELEAADRAIDAGLAIDPNDLDLLSMRAAVRFLADDRDGLTKAQRAVLDRHPTYARMFHVIAEYADWEHRYAEIVAMMKEAIRLDPRDGKSFVTLGLNQIRLGQEKDGVASLDLGFRKDRFNVRAFNTLNLFERDVPQKYESVDGPVFRVRYPKDEKKLLERYVPRLLDAAWADMQRRYGFTPKVPVGVEFYGTREHFAVRTSGLPNIGIQGVCFGETLAAISPHAEPFNWGMVVWHELGHVFAIQRSRSHVPRWFTEGLSEYETLARRPEWRRDEDPALYLALRRERVPTIAQMNRAFTHADDARDLTTAYYASTQIVVFLAERHGLPKVVAMLEAWGAGHRTPEVIKRSLGVSPDELDRQFRAWLAQRLERYAKQYMPDLRARPLAEAQKAAAAEPRSARAQIDLALAQLAAGDRAAARAALDAAKGIDAKNADARFLEAKLALQARKPDAARAQLEAMLAEGNDGYAVRMHLADLSASSGDVAGAQKHFEAASGLDPSQAEPVQALVDMARKAKDEERELRFLRRLAPLDRHDRRVWRRLLAKLVARGEWAEATRVGEGAVFVDVHGGETHALYAQAAMGAGDVDRAAFEAESALLCEGNRAATAARAHTVLARVHLARGDKGKARAARDEALRQDPANAEAKSLVIP